MAPVVVVLLLLPGLAEAQVLPLMSERTGATIDFWWNEPEAPVLGPLDEALLEALAPRGLDPSALEEAPLVSRIYRIPGLSEASARNLGGLYGATYVLLGDLELDEPGPTAGEVAWVVSGRLEYRLLSVEAGIVHLAGARALVGSGSNGEHAFTDARRRAAEHVGAEVNAAMSGLEPSAGEAPTVPTLVVRDLETAQPLVALMGLLRARDDVVADLAEVWASEGAIAVRVDLQPGQPSAALDALVDELSRSRDWEYRLVVIDRGGLRTEVRLEAREQPFGGPDVIE